MVRIPRRQYLTEKMEPYNATGGNTLRRVGEGLKDTATVVQHTVDRATPFAAAVRGTPNDNKAASFIRDITGINNQFAMVDLEGNAKIAATKANADLQKRWADDPTCPGFQQEVDQVIGQIFDEASNDVPVSQQLAWQKAKQSTLQNFKKANMEWAEKQSLSNLNRRVKKMNEEANNRANFYGENDSLDEFMSDNATARQLLVDMADDFGMSKEQKAEMLSAFDTQQIFNYLKGLAKNNPDKAEAIVNNNDALAIMLGTQGRKDLASAVKTAKTKKAKELTAELGMPITWGEPTKQATMAYAKRLEERGLERADAIKEAIRKMKEQENILVKERAMPGTTEERQKEIDNMLAQFTGYTENPFGDVSTFHDFYIRYKSGEEAGLTDKLNELGLDEDEAQIEYFDKIDKLIADGMSIGDAVDKVFSDHHNNPFGDAGTLGDFYNMYKEGEEQGLTDLINGLGLAEDDVALAFQRVDKNIAEGMSEEKALDAVFHEFDYTSRTKIEDYDNMSAEDWERLSADEQREALKRDLEKHIRKGRELQKTRASDLAKAQMYDDFNAFTSNPSDVAIAERKASPEYYLDNNYKKLTDAMEDWYKAQLKPSNVAASQPSNSMKEEKEVPVEQQIQDIFNSVSLLTAMQDNDVTLEDLFVAYYNDLAKMYNKGISEEYLQSYDYAARHVVMDKTFAKNMAYLTNSVKDYFPTSKFWSGSASGITQKELKNIVTREQGKAFAVATRMLVQDEGDPTRAVEYYKGQQDALYKNMLMRAHIDLDALEEKRLNKEPAIFYMNGVPQKYLGRDSSGNILSEDAWEVIQVPEAVPAPSSKADATKKTFEKAELRMPGFTKLVGGDNIFSKKD